MVSGKAANCTDMADWISWDWGIMKDSFSLECALDKASLSCNQVRCIKDSFQWMLLVDMGNVFMRMGMFIKESGSWGRDMAMES
jgi:hypothetical protein